ncbi:MAG: hypothetical protein GY909_03110 [Oligoflexia bacterium]|nr:hypothetical protein [Oligoflexia bacterium]
MTTKSGNFPTSKNNSFNIKSEEGFSLVQVMVSMGIAGMLMLALMKMQQQQSMQQRKAEVDIEINNFQSTFNGLIGRAGYCDKNFLDKSFSEETFEFEEFLKPNGSVKYKVGDKYGNGKFKIVSMMLKDFEFDDEPPEDGEQIGGSGLAILAVKLERLGKMFGTKTITKEFDVSLYLDENNVIKGCGSTAASGLLGGGGTGMSEKAINSEAIEAVVESQVQAQTDLAKTETETNKEASEAEQLQKQNEKLQAIVNNNDKVDMNDAKQVQKIIDNNPQLKLLQEQMLNMQKNNEKLNQILDEWEE